MDNFDRAVMFLMGCLGVSLVLLVALLFVVGMVTIANSLGS